MGVCMTGAGEGGFERRRPLIDSSSRRGKVCGLAGGKLLVLLLSFFPFLLFSHGISIFFPPGFATTVL